MPQPPAEPKSDQPEPEMEMTMGQWLRYNGPTLTILALLFFWLFMKFDADGLWNIGKAALGLGFVIFIHELGHFLVAKWCDVHVTVFSIGFGPAIPGCHFKWGETTYKLALFPLGGYVQMVGQVDADEAADDDDDPRSYRKKGVWQRMAIISAGVIMNAILAIICFIVVFQISGKDRQEAVVASVDPGKPAFVEGVRSGAEILQIGDIEHPFFDDLMVTVMGAAPGEHIPLVSKRPGDKEPISLEILPQVDKRPLLGISPARRPQLASKRMLMGMLKHPAEVGSVAERAIPSFNFDDVIVGMTNPEFPNDRSKMALNDPSRPGRPYFEYLRRMRLLAGQSITFIVERKDARDESRSLPLEIKVEAAFHRTLGVRMQMGQITAVRKKSPAAAVGVQPPDTEKKLEGDRIQWVAVRTPEGKVHAWGPGEIKGETPWPDGAAWEKPEKQEPLDPLRLPDQLRVWARTTADTPKGANLTVAINVKRHNPPAQNRAQYSDKTLFMTWDRSWEFDYTDPISPSSPWAISELGLAYQVQNTVAGVESSAQDPSVDLKNMDEPGPFFKAWAAVARHRSLHEQDEIKDVRFHFRLPEGDEDGPWASRVLKRDLKPSEWAHVFWRLQSNSIYKVTLKVKRGDKVIEVEMVPRPDPRWPQEERGLVLSPDYRKEKADNFVQAIGMGFRDTHKNMSQVFSNLRGMITGQISVENLGGPVTIARVAYRIAGVDFWEFVFFIGLISINLAVINFLPIPVLDGGHMVFLLYEKIKGKPAPEGFRVAATWAGLILILSLMVFVLYLDFTRIF